jgi:hypothetical protein
LKNDNQLLPWTDRYFVLKLISTGLLVPFFEELLMRGFIFRFSLQWYNAKKSGEKEPMQVVLDKQSVNHVNPGDWSWPAVVISTLAFTFGHYYYEWPAAAAFGLLMVLLWILRKDLVACIVAHSVTNIALGIFVFTTGYWKFW